MKRKMWKTGVLLTGLAAALALPVSCASEENDSLGQKERDGVEIPLDELAVILSSSGVGKAQMQEVLDAVECSAGNGYDEEYTMKDVFADPGCGVGGRVTRARSYQRPLRDLISEAVRTRTATKAGSSGFTAEEYLEALSSSDIQIYWPYSDSWDGETAPIVTFDPDDDSSVNVGYELFPDGSVQKIIVSEALAMERPVWVVNRNRDAAYKTLTLLERESAEAAPRKGTRAASSGDFKTLVMSSFQAMRNYDSWLAGGSEFWVKCGAVDDFCASTEAELRLYEPTITDFLIVVRRRQVGEVIPYNAVLVSEWTDQLESCAFMVVEDDGGTRTSWKCSAVVKYQSKSYGFEFEIPLNVRDDIVWRGQLSCPYIQKYSGESTCFGDVNIVLELVD